VGRGPGAVSSARPGLSIWTYSTDVDVVERLALIAHLDAHAARERVELRPMPRPFGAIPGFCGSILPVVVRLVPVLISLVFMPSSGAGLSEAARSWSRRRAVSPIRGPGPPPAAATADLLPARDTQNMDRHSLGSPTQDPEDLFGNLGATSILI
jgi:hypothetical protein